MRGPTRESNTVFTKPSVSPEAMALPFTRNTDDFQSDPETAERTGDDVSANFDLKQTFGETIAKTNVTIQASRTLSVEVGGEGDFNWLKTNTIYFENGVLTPLPAADIYADEPRGEIFVTATWQAFANLSVEAGLRTEVSRIASSGEVVSGRSLVYPKPRLALAYSPDGSDQLRPRIEREVGQLDFNDVTDVHQLRTGRYIRLRFIKSFSRGGRHLDFRKTKIPGLFADPFWPSGGRGHRKSPLLRWPPLARELCGS